MITQKFDYNYENLNCLANPEITKLLTMFCFQKRSLLVEIGSETILRQGLFLKDRNGDIRA